MSVGIAFDICFIGHFGARFEAEAVPFSLDLEMSIRGSI